MLLGAAIAAGLLKYASIAVAPTLAVAGYACDLVRQQNFASLQMPLKTVGRQALLLSTLYSALLTAGLW